MLDSSHRAPATDREANPRETQTSETNAMIDAKRLKHQKQFGGRHTPRV